MNPHQHSNESQNSQLFNELTTDIVVNGNFLDTPIPIGGGGSHSFLIPDPSTITGGVTIEINFGIDAIQPFSLLILPGEVQLTSTDWDEFSLDGGGEEYHCGDYRILIVYTSSGGGGIAIVGTVSMKR